MSLDLLDWALTSRQRRLSGLLLALFFPFAISFSLLLGSLMHVVSCLTTYLQDLWDFFTVEVPEIWREIFATIRTGAPYRA